VFEPREGAAFLERALILNPHLALAWQYSGLLKAFLGESEIAIERLARAMRLSPLDPGLYSMQTAMALAHFIGGDYDTALSWTDKASREDPNFLPTFRIAATSAGLAGRLAEAKRAIARMLQIDPTSRISNLREHVPLERPQDLARYAEGLRLAGLPE
jgi:tetratricopeptide (TPR) repeat protein